MANNRSSRKSRFSRRNKRVKAKVNSRSNPIQSRLQSAGFTQKQLNNLKTQHASFKKHQKAGTLSTHQKKYGTGPYSLSGAERAQQAAKDTAVNIGKWGTKFAKNTASEFGDMMMGKPTNLNLSTQKPSLLNTATAFT